MRKFWAIFCLCLTHLVQAEVSQPVQGKLENGLRYTILPLHEDKGRIEIRMKVYAGSVDETDEQAGVAHMVEHLVFRGTHKYPNGLMPYLHEQKWVRGRNYNAVTSNDSTTYMLTPPKASNLDQSLEVLSQMLFFATMSQQDLDDERKVILEEWRAGQGVGQRMNRARTNVVRMDSRYTRHPVIGTQESIQTMPAQQLQQFYRAWYAPNNMQLLIVGDTRVEVAEKLIKQYFEAIPTSEVATRDYLEPKLSNALRTVQIQDEQSGVSQIAYILRFDESRLRQQTDEGRYARLLDRLAVATVAQRLRNEQETLPSGIRSIVLRKSDIGQNSVALALFAGVDEQSHQQGLQQIFMEIERLRRFPITQAELDLQKEKIQAQIERAKMHKSDRDFSGWVQAMVNSVLMDQPYLSQPEIAARTEPMLHQITIEALNQYIQSWFAQQDRIVQYQAPRLTHIEPITADLVKNWQKQTALQSISAPTAEKMIEPMALEKVASQGKILSQQHFSAENVHYFTLSNGDRVVWLKSPTAKEKSYFEARSQAGFKAKNLGQWQSQIAVQLIAQNAPLDWEIEQLNRWKALKKVNLNLSQTADELVYSGTVDNAHLADLLRLYYAYQQETQIKAGVDETKEAIAASIDLAQAESMENQRLKALNRLRFGRERTDILPDKTGLTNLSEDELNRLWQSVKKAPTTYYFVNDLTKAQMEAFITQYLTGIPRQQALEIEELLPIMGREVVRFSMNLEPKDNVQMWFFNEHQWQGKDAVLVSLLRSIVANKLKLVLRDEHLGIYSLRFESSLNPNSQRIESQLSFSTSPENSEKMVVLAEDVLKKVAKQIKEEEVQTAKAQFLQSEKERLKSPHAWLNRLILSDKQYHSPRYLGEVEQLAEAITLKNIQQMADKLYNENNLKVFITTQKQK